MKVYAGFGSRETPRSVCLTMTFLGTFLCSSGWILRSGGAKGADQAFETGVRKDHMKEIYRATDPISREAFELAEMFHPAWDSCDDYARKLHARNGYIVLGRELDSPVDFGVCWTPGGKVTGGSGQALRIMKDRDIPVFNLWHGQEAVDALFARLRVEPIRLMDVKVRETPSDTTCFWQT